MTCCLNSHPDRRVPTVQPDDAAMLMVSGRFNARLGREAGSLIPQCSPRKKLFCPVVHQFEITPAYLKNPKTCLDRVSTGSGSDLVSDQHVTFLRILDPLV